MKKIIVLLAMALLTASSFGEWSPLIWDIKYDATVLPVNSTVGSTAVQAWNGTAYADASRFALTGTGVTSSSVSDGVFSASTINSNTTGYWQRNLTSGYPVGTVMPSSAVGYAFEVKMKILDTEGVSMGLITFEEGTSGVTKSLTLGFYNVLETVDLGSGRILDTGTWVYLSGPGTQYTKVDAADVFDFHTYRILADNDSVNLFIDGSTTIAQTMTWGGSSINGFRFGDASAAQDASYQLDYIGIHSGASVIPEPATMLLLGLGSCCLRLRRKRN